MEDEMKTTYMTVDEAADYLKVDRSTIYNYINNTTNPMPCYKISRNNIRIRKDELDRWVENYLKAPKEETV